MKQERMIRVQILKAPTIRDQTTTLGLTWHLRTGRINQVGSSRTKILKSMIRSRSREEEHRIWRALLVEIM